MNIRAVTFDLDDTLWPVAPVIERAERAMHAWLAANCPALTARYDVAALREIRRRIADDHPHLAHDFSALRRRSLEHALHEHGYDGEHVEGAFGTFYAARQEVELFDDALPALERLTGRYALASISNGNADLEIIGLAYHFPVRVHARHVGCAKPDAGIFLAACDALACEPGEVVHVGDDPVLDVTGAREAGMHPIWLNRDRAPWPGAGPAPPTLSSLAALPELLASGDGA